MQKLKNIRLSDMGAVALALKGAYLHLMAPLLGFLSLVVKRQHLTRSDIPFLVLPLYAALLGLFYKDPHSVGRSMQFLGIVLLFMYAYKEKIRLNFFHLSLLILFFGAFTLVYDLVLGTTLYQKAMLGVRLPRYKGIVREYNFSACLYLFSYLIFIRQKHFLFALLSFLLIISTGSRGALIALFTGSVLILLESKTLNKALVIFMLFYPLFSYSSQFFPSRLQRQVNALSSKRMVVQQIAIDQVKEKPWGVGYFRGRNILREIKKTGKFDFHSFEPHNIVVQVLFELGFVGYFLLFWIFWSLRKTMSLSSEFVTILLSYMFLNGLHELALYLGLLTCGRKNFSEEAKT